MLSCNGDTPVYLGQFVTFWFVADDAKDEELVAEAPAAMEYGIEGLFLVTKFPQMAMGVLVQ